MARPVLQHRLARREGFKRPELMATMAGEPLYCAGGYIPIETAAYEANGVTVPLLRMGEGVVAERSNRMNPRPRSAGRGRRNARDAQGKPMFYNRLGKSSRNTWPAE